MASLEPFLSLLTYTLIYHLENRNLGQGLNTLVRLVPKVHLKKNRVKLYSSYIGKKKVCAYFAICTYSLGILQERLCT
jgi:hypothetical protein